MPFFAHGHSKKSNYQFGGILGRGGYSEVRSAVWNGQGSSKSPGGPIQVAVKVVSKSYISDKANYLRILQAQERMRVWRNRSAIELYDWFESTSKFYVVFELLDGELFDYLVDQPYSEVEAIQVIRKILDSLVYCHNEIGIIHRDIKPENFLFRNGDHMDVVLTDFGIARVLDDPSERERLHDVCGTPGYAAPEIYRMQGYDRKCDLLQDSSLGIFTYAILTSWSPWNHSKGMELVQETLESPITFPSSRWQHISETAREFVLALTVRDPRSRPSAVEARRHKWLAQKSEEAASPVKKPPVELPEAGDTLQRQPTMKPDDEEHPIVRRLTQRKASS